jgi:beta-glucanase (GH16 family)
MQKRIGNLVIVFILVCLTTLLTGFWQDQLSIISNLSVLAQVKPESLKTRETSSRTLDTTPLFLDKMYGKNWKLAFGDNFNGTTLNLRKWNTCYWWSDAGGCTNSYNNELQWYQPDDVFLENGSLRLQAQARSVKSGYNYTSGMVTTEGKFSFQYGYFEIRAKVPQGQGLWSAFWTLPTNRNLWPPEIDVMEVLGHQPERIYLSNHFRNNGEADFATQDYIGDDFSADFHRFGVLWESDRIIWVVDGVERFRVTDNIPNIPMYLLINLAVGGNWPGPPNNTTVFPNYYDIDYIRVWQKTE